MPSFHVAHINEQGTELHYRLTGQRLSAKNGGRAERDYL